MGGNGGIGQVARRPQDDGAGATGWMNMLSEDKISQLKLSYSQLDQKLSFESFMAKFEDVADMKIMMTLLSSLSDTRSKNHSDSYRPVQPLNGEKLFSVA